MSNRRKPLKDKWYRIRGPRRVVSREPSVVNEHKDRSLPGKKRKRARRVTAR